MPRWSALALVVPTLLLAGEAEARPRPLAGVAPAAPTTRAAVWKDFTARRGRWWASWDATTGTPRRIWGEGIAAPGASRDADVAAAASRALVERELTLLAPGSKPAHWRLVANLTHGPDDALRTVSFQHVLDGVPVRGSAISVLWKRDRAIVLASTARAVSAATTRPTISVERAAQAAVADLAGARLRGDGALELVGTGAARLAWRFDVDAGARGRWDVAIDATTGAQLERRARRFEGAATLRFDAPLRYPAGGRQAFAATGVDLDVGTPVVTDGAGRFSFPGLGPIAVTVRPTGPRVTIVNAAGARASTTLSASDGGTVTWAAPTDEAVDAQLSAFIHASRAKDFARTALDPSLPWLAGVLEVTVNESGTCNAYSDGDGLHFLAAGDGCENTARIADFVYHEFSHSLHVQSIIPGAGDTDVPLAEGLGDYFAATLVDDPRYGRGAMIGSSAPTRDLDPAGREYAWPRDVDTDPHITGLILAGALWDLRRELMTSLGAGPGRAHADRLFYAVMRRAADIPGAYPELLAADDDDGNLANGTPNRCAIDLALAPHGLVDASANFGVRPPTRTGFQIDLEVNPIAGCAAPMVTGATLVWKVGAGAPTTIAMGVTSDGYTATIPTQADGTVVDYRATVTLVSGAVLEFPANPGDPYYQFYVGDLQPVYCTDFEANPFSAGWTHRATAGNDDWDWGPPMGDLSNADPLAAASGVNVVGTDLRGDGVYQRDAAEILTSPVIDVRGYTGVRVQFKRWLAVEDGFYDQASIAADGVEVWHNFASAGPEGQTHTIDREWRSIDLDVDAAAADGQLQLEFRLATDEELHFGGWNLDDFCVMAAGTGPRPSVCGNGVVETGESCDDGNTTAGDGCSELCANEDPPPSEDGCCSTGADPRAALGLGAVVGLLVTRRRRRA